MVNVKKYFWVLLLFGGSAYGMSASSFFTHAWSRIKADDLTTVQRVCLSLASQRLFTFACAQSDSIVEKTVRGLFFATGLAATVCSLQSKEGIGNYLWASGLNLCLSSAWDLWTSRHHIRHSWANRNAEVSSSSSNENLSEGIGNVPVKLLLGGSLFALTHYYGDRFFEKPIG